MRKIIESTLMSVDGVIEDPAQWVGDFLDAEFQRAAYERLLESDVMLMGRRTYELLSRDWVGQTGEFADRISSIPKYVFSSSLGKADWSNSTIVNGDVVHEVTRLKQQAGNGDLAVYGHGQLAKTLLQAGLLDEIRISVFPIVLGQGQVAFGDGVSSRLQLLESFSLQTGVVVMRYRCAAQANTSLGSVAKLMPNRACRP